MSFDLQAHRGGMGLRPQNTLAAFANALAIGVTTLECDMQVSRDGHAVLSHERLLIPEVFEGPHVGRFICELDWAALAEMTVLGVGGPQPMCTLDDLLDLLGERQVGINVETKFDVLHPDESAPRERFVEVLLATLGEGEGEVLGRTSVQSFDWAVLDLVHHAEPRLALNALANLDKLQLDQPGASPWLGGIDIDDFEDDLAQAAASRHYDAISPRDDMLTPALIKAAHQLDLRVLPYTIDEPGRMGQLIAWGIDGFITNRPDVARTVLREHDIELPQGAAAEGTLGTAN